VPPADRGLFPRILRPHRRSGWLHRIARPDHADRRTGPSWVRIRHWFAVESAPKWCSRQAGFHHILNRRSSPFGTGQMSEGRAERRLAAILAVDVAGYSRLMGADEEGTLAALRAVRRELGDPKIAEHRGRIVKTTGDGLLAKFVSVVDAVRCAVAVQREMITRNAAAPAERHRPQADHRRLSRVRARCGTRSSRTLGHRPAPGRPTGEVTVCRA
jgi:hypothetical protein